MEKGRRDWFLIAYLSFVALCMAYFAAVVGIAMWLAFR